MVERNTRNEEIEKAIVNFETLGVEGITVKKYIELCKVLGLTVCSSGRSKVRHLEKINECFDLERKGNSYKILGLKKTLEEFENKLKAKRKTVSKFDKYDDDFELALILYMWNDGRYNEGLQRDRYILNLNSYAFKQMLGIRNHDYVKEYSHVSSNMRLIKKDFFFRYDELSTTIIKRFWGKWEAVTLSNNEEAREWRGIRIQEKYKLSKYMVQFDKNEFPTVLTNALKAKLEKEETDRVKRAKQRVIKELTEKYEAMAGGVDYKEIINEEIQAMEKAKKFEPKKLSELYRIWREERWVTEEEKEEILKIERNALKSVGAQNKRHAKFLGKFKDYDNKVERDLLKKFDYTTYVTMYQFSAPKDTVNNIIKQLMEGGSNSIIAKKKQELSQECQGYSMDRLVNELLYEIVGEANSMIIDEFMQVLNHRAEEVDCGMKINRRNGSKRNDDIITQIAQEVRNSEKHKTYIDIVSAMVQLYIRISRKDITYTHNDIAESVLHQAPTTTPTTPISPS